MKTMTQSLTPLLTWLFAAWLLGSLLFAHGCHGNEDHELWGKWIESLCAVPN